MKNEDKSFNYWIGILNEPATQKYNAVENILKCN